jgi:hypothetical protein
MYQVTRCPIGRRVDIGGTEGEEGCPFKVEYRGLAGVTKRSEHKDPVFYLEVPYDPNTGERKQTEIGGHWCISVPGKISLTGNKKRTSEVEVVSCSLEEMILRYIGPLSID